MKPKMRSMERSSDWRSGRMKKIARRDAIFK